MGRNVYGRRHNGKPQPANFNDQTTGEGSTALGYYNVNTGDMPYFTHLARQYTISDNYHQPVMGGTGANSIMIGTADALYYTDGNGNAATPPSNQIENPRPRAGTNNWYTQDGYSGGSYSDCSDPSSAGRRRHAPLPGFAALPSEGQLRAGRLLPAEQLQPRLQRRRHGQYEQLHDPAVTRADDCAIRLLAKSISWKYYGEGWNTFVIKLGHEHLLQYLQSVPV